MNPAPPARRPACVGYLDVLRDPQLGFTGGLLIVSSSGRPLEFHCSTPLAPTRAQEILFGPTLCPHVCGELIAPALLSAARLTPTVLLVRDRRNAPLKSDTPTLVLPAAIKPGEPPELASWPSGDPAVQQINVSGVALDLFQPHEAYPIEARELLAELAGHIALDEPFERVQEAVREAQRLGSQEVADEHAA